MQHLPLRTYMITHGLEDHAGRLLSDDDRHAAYPEHHYWEARSEEVIDRLLEHLDPEFLSAHLERQPDDSTAMQLYYSWLQLERSLEVAA